jgi:glucose-6-phosphate isomerase
VSKKSLYTINNIQNRHLSKNYLKKSSQKLQKCIKEITKEIDDPNKTLNILNKKFIFNFQKKDLNKFKKYKTIALIGMGGSILGAKAINGFLDNKIRKEIYFFDDLDTEKIIKFKKKRNLNNVLFLVISKSGDTVETISNFLALNIIKKSSKNIIIITEKKNNQLFSLSKKLNLFYVEHKNSIGGRFSVLSEVGIIPAYLMGINILKLRSGIQDLLKGKEKLFLKDSSKKLASLLNSKKINNLIFLNYSPKLEKFLYWCQQLIAESLGKKGKGFLPVVSNVPRDHHSLLQLYLDGPRDKLFHIFSVEEKPKVKISAKKIIKMKNFLDKKSLSSIKIAQKNALIAAFKKNKIPYREFKIKKVNEEVLGKLFTYFMLETVIIAKLVKVDPFGQPAVEQVKVYTKKLLS